MALFSIMGIRLLFLDSQLFDCWLWRCCSPANVANVGPHRKCHRRPDVRLVCEPSVRHRDPACGTERDRVLLPTHDAAPLAIASNEPNAEVHARIIQISPNHYRPLALV